MSTKNERIFQTWLTERLAMFGEDVAVEYGNQTKTFKEIDRESNIIAHWIIHQGIGQGTFIGAYSTDRIKILISIIGILKAGCVFVPLDTALPASRLEMMVETVELEMILWGGEDSATVELKSSPLLKDRGVEFEDVTMILLDANESWSLPVQGVDYMPDDKIYVYFTSGTTGRPKAIVGRNKSLHHFITWEIETFHITRGVRVSQLITPGFDAFLRDVFVPLGVGGVLCIPADRNIVLNPDTLSEWVEKFQINMIHCVPGVFRLLVSDQLTPGQFTALKYVFLSGEPVTHSLLEPWYRVIGERVQLVNFYGPSETTMIKAFYLVKKEDLQRERIPIGQPMKGCRFVILDEDMNICDEQVTGEIYIRTPYYTHGYYKEEALNREKFIPNPLSGDPGDIVFRTGDLGRWLPDGNIEFLGRKDRQVKIRGVRVELEEVEAALLKHPLVREAAVIKKVMNTNEMLCAFISIPPGTGEEGNLVHRLREYLIHYLPDYMVPSLIKPLSTLPKKPNGKVDYQSLPDPFAGEAEYVPPRTPTEQKLVEIWQEILAVESIGIRHGFFELGGNSLNIISLISFIHRDFNIKLSVAELFSHDTIEKQAELLKREGSDIFTVIEPVGEKPYYILSSVQRRLFFLQQVNPENMSYNMPRVLVLEGKYDLDRLVKVFPRLVERHESLRTSFHMLEGKPLQVVHKVSEIKFAPEVHNLEGEGIDEDGDINHAMVLMILSEFMRPFDLGKAPLMRVGFIRLDEERLIFMIDTHHIVSDGISQGIFVKEYLAYYQGEELEPLRLYYKDFAEWMNHPQQQEWMKQQEAYWLKRFAGELPLLDVPMDFERPATQTFVGFHYGFIIDEEQTRQLKKLAMEEEVTLFMILLAAFNVFLSRITGQEDIIIGSSLAGRRHPGLNGIMGMFVNTLVMRNYPTGDKSFREFLKEVKHNTLVDFENQDYQFENLLEKINVQRIPGRNPLFDVMFILNNEEAPALQLPGVKVSFYPHYEKEAAQMDLKLRVVEVQGQLSAAFEYSTRLFKTETVEMFIENYREVIAMILANADVCIEEIRLTHGLLSTRVDTSALSFEF